MDSVPGGPGINDNGSGSAVALELLLQLHRLYLGAAAVHPPGTLKNRVRFAWWAAEELGLAGSQQYLQTLYLHNRSDYDTIAVNINMDMVAR